MKDCTKELQKEIDSSEKMIFRKGDYLCSPLFFHSDMEILFEDGVRLFLTDDENSFHRIPTRIAGIEMDGYPALLNFIGCRNVRVSGKAILYGNGKRWYEKYWGVDMHGGMRKEYDAKGLRWACDYDCHRPKVILIQQSSDIHVSDLELHDSPFWNVHVLYSDHVFLSDMRILSEDRNSPSTDGIDIDSSEDVFISSCHISTNDDGISIKSGRDKDGLRVNRPTRNVVISDCEFHHGYGLGIGSELSGGIEDIEAKNLVFVDSDCGFRIKSSQSRKGYVKNIRLQNLDMHQVKYPFYCYLDWNPAYNHNRLPEGYEGDIPSYWEKLLDLPGDDMKNTIVEGLKVKDVRLDCGECRSCLFTVRGFDDSPIKGMCFDNLFGIVDEYGTFENCEEPVFHDYLVLTKDTNRTVPGEFDNR